MRPSITFIQLTAAAFLLAAQPSYAQTTEDPNATDPAIEVDVTAEGTEESDGEVDGNFSRSIPQGLSANLSEEEIADYQAKLDAASTPQERNTIRQELQRLNQQRHVESVQGGKAQPQGFFAKMADDFKGIVSGKAARDAKANSGAGNDGNAKGGKGGKGGNSGKSDRGGSRGGGGGNGGGGGGGRNK